MTKPEQAQQLKKYAEDLKEMITQEKKKSAELKNANRQMQEYARDLKKTIRQLERANRRLKRQVEIEETEKRLQKKMIHINKMTSLGTLSAGIAHEINNPISYILGNSQILQELWEEIQKALEKIAEDRGNFALKGIPFEEITDMIPRILKNNIEGARQISQITGKLKDFSRRGEQLAGTLVDIREVIDYTTAVLDRQIREHTVNFQVKVKKNIPPAIGNSHELEQVLLNIVQNALQALPDSSCGVTLSASHDSKQGMIWIRITDEGRGIEPRMMDRIMEPFFTTRQNTGGTGLGLYISYSIVRKMGGNLEIFSKPGEGTRVVINLPAAERGTDHADKQ